jgi:flavin-dependent thymidylate synthase
MAGQNNKVELIGFYGSDLTHALSAWTSTSRDLTEDKRARVGKLITQLAGDGHHSVFEKSMLHFLATTDIATHIQLLKHRIGVSINGESARYKELKDDKYYLPQDWDQEELDLYIAHMEESLTRYHKCLERLVAKGMPRKRAKETARFYLPYGNQITVDISFNFRSFAHFVGLRYTGHAQKEICELAGAMLSHVKDIGAFPRTLEAFGFVDETGTIVPPLG